MGYWRKFYAAGNSITATDRDVASKKVGWRSTPSEGLVAVSLVHDGYQMRIEGIGEYWQSDRMEASFPVTRVSCTKRHIEKKIESTDRHFRVLTKPNETYVVFNGGLLDGARFFPVDKSMHGKWLILEYDVHTQETRCYVRDSKL